MTKPAPDTKPFLRPPRRFTGRRYPEFFAALLGGVLLGLAYHPGGLGALAWFAYVPLFWAARDCSPLEALALGGVYGTTGVIVGYPFGAGFLRMFLGGGTITAYAWLLVLAGCEGFLHWGLGTAAGALAPRRWRTAGLALALVAGERYLPALLPTPLAMTQLFHLPTVQCLEVFGCGAVAVLVMGANASLFSLLAAPRRAAPYALAAAALIAGNELWGRRALARYQAAAGGSVLRAGIVQGGSNFSSETEADRFFDNLPLYADLTRRDFDAGASDLIVWPESTFSARIDYTRTPAAAASVGGRPLASALPGLSSPAPILLSAVGAGADARLRSVSVLVGPDRSALGFAEKMILIPFGEYMPFEGVLPILRRLSPRTGHLSPGPFSRPLRLNERVRLGVLICYENMLAEPAADLVDEGADVLVVQANDFMLDRPQGAEMHLSCSRLRAIENRRTVLHAAKTGVSAIVSATGEVLARIEKDRPGFLAAAIPVYEARTAFHTGHPWIYRFAGASWAAVAGLAFVL
jgi:apolipoprotein N-acyltransferase